MSTPRVSFIIPTHNRAGLLPAAVRSAATGGGDLEIIVIDDASTDDTPRVCAALVAEIPRVRIVRLEQNVGLAAARNAGIAVSRGEYLAFLDDDDQRLPDSLPAQIAALDTAPEAGLTYAPVELVDAAGRRLGKLQPEPSACLAGDIFWELLKENYIRVPSVVVRRTALDAVGPFQPGLRQVEDRDCWIRIAERYPVAVTSAPVALYRQGDVASAQLSTDHATMALTTKTLLEEWLKLPRAAGAPQARREAIRRHFAETHFHLLIVTAAERLGLGLAGAARRDLTAAWRIAPLRALTSRVPRLWLRSFLPLRKNENLARGPGVTAT